MPSPPETVPRKKYRMRGTALLEHTVCRQCGTACPLYGNYHHRRGPSTYCSRACRYEWYRANGWPRSKAKSQVECRTCGMAFTPRAKAHVFCSRKCSSRNITRIILSAEERTVPSNRRHYLRHRDKIRERSRAYHTQNKEAIKERERRRYEQNREGILAKNRARRLARLDEALARERAYNKAHPERNRTASRNRKAKVRGAFVESVSRAVLFKRDRGICQLCHRRMTMRQASVDHIVPISLGGKHSYENTQVAHLRCNVRKGAKIVGQLRLFGLFEREEG